MKPLNWSSMTLCKDFMLSSFFKSSPLTMASIVSYFTLFYIFSFIIFSAVILSLKSKFFLIYSWDLILSSCSVISLLIVSWTLFSNLLWKSACIFLKISCKSYPTRSFCAISLAIASLSFICSFLIIKWLLLKVIGLIRMLRDGSLLYLPINLAHRFQKMISGPLSIDSSRNLPICSTIQYT